MTTPITSTAQALDAINAALLAANPALPGLSGMYTPSGSLTGATNGHAEHLIVTVVSESFDVNDTNHHDALDQALRDLSDMARETHAVVEALTLYQPDEDEDDDTRPALTVTQVLDLANDALSDTQTSVCLDGMYTPDGALTGEINGSAERLIATVITEAHADTTPGNPLGRVISRLRRAYRAIDLAADTIHDGHPRDDE